MSGCVTRAAHLRAGGRLVAVDPVCELVCREKRAGSTEIARRVSGAKARAEARRSASWRSTGIPGKREREDRAAVRAAVRDSLGVS